MKRKPVAVQKANQAAKVGAAAETKTAETVKAEVKDTVKAVETKISEKVNDAAAKTSEIVNDAAAKASEKAVEKAAETKEAVKTAAKKTAAKVATKKETKAAEKEALVPEVYIQYTGREANEKDVIERIKAAYVAEGHRAGSIKSLRVYFKPEEDAAYYVINQKYPGRVSLF